MISECNFSYKHYFEVLEYAKTKYDIGTIKEFPRLRKKKSYIILRHDVDLSLDAALKMAEFEAKHNLRATYFILLHSTFYNALSGHNISIIKKISKLGHEIGLHYDTTFFGSSKSKKMKQISLESSILADIINRKITSIAQHNPSITQDLEIKTTPGFMDPMKSESFQDALYISDSIQNWRRGCMCNHINKGESKLHILTHTIWWNEYHKSREAILEEYKKYENEKFISVVTDMQKVHSNILRTNK